MTEKELRKMSRAELLIDQMEENGRLQKQLAQAFTLLKKREITITDECFLSAEPEEVHEHTAECFALVRDALVCELPESEGHTHGESCFGEGAEVLICTVDENHVHSAELGCYATEESLICAMAENHIHSAEEGCYEYGEAPVICGLEEAQGHIHGDECYTMAEQQICEFTGEAGDDAEIENVFDISLEVITQDIVTKYVADGKGIEAKWDKDAKNYTISDLADGYYIVINESVPEDTENTVYSRYILEVVRNVNVTHKGTFPTVEKKIVEGQTELSQV